VSAAADRAIQAPGQTVAPARERAGASAVGSVLVGAATALVILAAALLVLLQPTYIHAALGQAGSASVLGITPGQAEALSDRTVTELIAGPGTFAFAGPSGSPFYDPAEAAHLRDARMVLWLFLGLSGVALVGLLATLASPARRAWAWRAIRRGAAALAVGMALIGAFFLIAFDLAFELFHRIFFPGGNWAFDPSTQRLVQLYPIAFWQVTAAALGGLAIGLAAATWWVAGRRARSPMPASRPSEP
jgi:integral membrane protein (TIGR01906 family)